MKTQYNILLIFFLLLNMSVFLAAAPDDSNVLRFFQAQPLEKAVKLSWPKPTRKVFAYRIYRQLSSQTRAGQTATLLKQLDRDSQEYIDRDIEEDKVYVYYLTLLDEQKQESDKSVLRAARSLDVTPPGKPTHVRVKVLDDKFGIHFYLSWKKPQDKDVTGYRIYRGMQGIQAPVSINIVKASTKPLQFVDTVQNSNVQNWLYSVAAVDSAGNESEMAEPVLIRSPDHQPPAAPLISNLRALEKGIQVEWRSPADNDLSDYRIYRRTGNQPWKKLATVSAKQFQYLDTTAFTGHRYQYAVSALDQDKNEGPRSSPRSQVSLQRTALPAPDDLQIRRKGKQLELRWNPVKGNDFLGYFIYRRVANENGFIKISPLLRSNNFKVPAQLKGNVEYRLVALYAQGRQSKPVDFPLLRN